ncbi:phosphoribosylanthranilate isomerase [Mucilaginibacter segetis]|uniref:N-(5'-phosphoribosyl)anthranilate isomerase n=1 Tax=Mucilaginibacter segetis TaxID=2793071 RepID=A0A934PX83_9SPHI|nr:phosphoribosylanthranilate isomerase [Mucilaginibacter segetis]MBK0381060.1 phosphoribosylanthranilate isomerase [Mucilaginibacter segetis]
MKIKVCGLKYQDNINAVADLAPDYMGFICYDRSPRFIGQMENDLFDELPNSIIKTAVFVNENAEQVSKLIALYKFSAIQLHGNESPDFCNRFKNKVTVIKAYGVDEDFDFGILERYKNNVDFFMFDTKTAEHGGSGRKFNWDILNKYELNVPFFLSGGLSPDNMEEVKKIDHPMFYAVDLNSRFETSPGIKDINKLTTAFNTIKKFNSDEVRS